MRTTNKTFLAIASIVSMAVSAQGETIAGWDFSQYRGDGALTTDGVTFTANSLDANYSSLDPTRNAGAESAAFGTAHFDGSNGSSSTTTLFLPTAGAQNCFRGAVPPEGCATPNVDGPVRSNRTEPFAEQGQNGFDSRTVLIDEGQTFASLLGMTALGTVDVVFEADLGSSIAKDWEVSFGGKTFNGGGSDGGELACGGACSSTVSVEFSTDGSSYASFGSVMLDPDDTRFSVPLDSDFSDIGYVRLGFSTGSGQPIVDNVAVEATVVGPKQGDADSDSIDDLIDNCLAVANSGQVDTDGDGCGNACDADYDNSGLSGATDFNTFRASFGLSIGQPGYNPAVDSDGNNSIGSFDFNFLRDAIGTKPGLAGAGLVVTPALCDQAMLP